MYRFSVLVGIFISVSAISSCTRKASYPSCSATQYASLSGKGFGNWNGCRFSANGLERTVFELDSNAPEKPPILVFHELIGLTPETLAYAAGLGDEFSVYTAALFGKPAQDNLLLGFINGILSYAFNGEWHPEENRPVYSWARHLSHWIRPRHPGERIGVIGMCLTGAMPLALLENENITAVVVSQPTLPLIAIKESSKSSLALSKLELEIAVQRVENRQVKILGLRFEQDTLGDRKKLATLKRIFKEGYIDREISAAEQAKFKISDNAHSVLIYDWTDNPRNHPTNKRRMEIRAFLFQQLKQVPP